MAARTFYLGQRLHVDREDALPNGVAQLVVGLARAGEDDVFGGYAGGPHHGQLAGGGDLAARRRRVRSSWQTATLGFAFTEYETSTPRASRTRRTRSRSCSPW